MSKRRRRESGRQQRISQLRRQASRAAGPTRGSFDRLVEEALGEIPEPFRCKLQNVAVVVEEEPSLELLESLGMPHHESLFGLYDGVPLTDRGDWYNLVSPDRIVIFRRPILAVCSSIAEIKEQVRLTVIHEVAHYYGIDDEELERRELG